MSKIKLIAVALSFILSSIVGYNCPNGTAAIISGAVIGTVCYGSALFYDYKKNYGAYFNV